MTAHYGKVLSTFWTQGSGKRLRGHQEAQLVALYLFTCEASNMLGLYHLTLPSMAHDIGLDAEGARKGLKRVCQEGIAEYDEKEELVYLPEGARIRVAEELKPNDNRRKGIEKALVTFRKHAFFNSFLGRYAEAFHLELEPNDAPPPEPFAGPSEGAPQAPSKPGSGSGSGAGAGAEGLGGTKPAQGKPAPTTPSKNSKKKSSKSRPETPFPDDFKVTEETYREARKSADMRFDRRMVDQLVGKFRDKALEKGWTAKLWQSKFRNFLRNERRFYPNLPEPRPEPKGPPPAPPPRHPEIQRRADELQLELAGKSREEQAAIFQASLGGIGQPKRAAGGSE